MTGLMVFCFVFLFYFISFLFFASNHKVADKITCPSKFKSIYFEDRWIFVGRSWSLRYEG